MFVNILLKDLKYDIQGKLERKRKEREKKKY